MHTEISNWKSATTAMPWGVQSAFVTALETVRDDGVKMVYGADSYAGSPCLVNAINAMIHKDAGASPTGFAPSVVGAFDALNRALHATVGEPQTDANFVTPFAAEVLLHHFGDRAQEPEIMIEPESVMDQPYVEKSDTELMQEWLTAQTKPEEVACDVLPTERDLAEIEEFLQFKAQ